MRVRLHGPAGEFILAEGDNVLGRTPDCSLLVHDPRLSRRHATFSQIGAVLRVHDLGSMNGVLVNGTRIMAPTVLHDHDVVVCGPCRFTCEIDLHGQSAPVRPATVPVPGPQTGTEPINPEDAAATQPDPARPRGRILDSKIAAAVGTTRTGQPAANSVPAAPVDIPTDHLRPNDQPESKTTSALSNHPPQAHGSSPSRQTSRRTTDITPHSNRIRGDSALQPRVSAQAGRRQRTLAGLADVSMWLGLQALLLVPLGSIGYVIALHAQGAEIKAGLPTMPPLVGATPAPWSELIVSLIDPGAASRAIQLIPHLAEDRHGAPFLTLFITATAMALVLVLSALLGLVATTVLNGGPLWHRRLGLEIVAMHDGAYPSWARATFRWFLLAVLWPLAPWFAFAKLRSPHDVLSGCDVRRRAL